MTKKFSILSIVVVLLFSMCFVGCGDSSNGETTNAKSGNDSIALEDYSKEIVGTWKLVEVLSRDGRKSEKCTGNSLWIFNSDGTCKITKYDGYDPDIGTYKLSRTTPEISLSREGNDWLKITKFTKNRLEIKYEGTFVLERK